MVELNERKSKKNEDERKKKNDKRLISVSFNVLNYQSMATQDDNKDVIG